MKEPELLAIQSWRHFPSYSPSITETTLIVVSLATLPPRMVLTTFFAMLCLLVYDLFVFARLGLPFTIVMLEFLEDMLL